MLNGNDFYWCTWLLLLSIFYIIMYLFPYAHQILYQVLLCEKYRSPIVIIDSPPHTIPWGVQTRCGSWEFEKGWQRILEQNPINSAGRGASQHPDRAKQEAPGPGKNGGKSRLKLKPTDFKLQYDFCCLFLVLSLICKHDPSWAEITDHKSSGTPSPVDWRMVNSSPDAPVAWNTKSYA